MNCLRGPCTGIGYYVSILFTCFVYMHSVYLMTTLIYFFYFLYCTSGWLCFRKGFIYINTIWISYFFERSPVIFLPYNIKFIFSLFLAGLSSGSLYHCPHFLTLTWLLKHHTLLIPFSLMPFLLRLTQGLCLLLVIKVWSF